MRVRRLLKVFRLQMRPALEKMGFEKMGAKKIRKVRRGPLEEVPRLQVPVRIRTRTEVLKLEVKI